MNNDPDNTREWADPFLQPSSKSMPKEHEDAMRMAKYLFYINSTYKEVVKRLVSLFNTGYDFVNYKIDKSERAEWEYHLNSEVNIRGKITQMGLDWGCYGNSFAKINYPFERNLVIHLDNGKTVYRAASSFSPENIKYIYQDLQYEVRLEANGPTYRADFTDVYVKDRSKITITFLEPTWIYMKKAFFSEKKRIMYRFTPEYLADIKRGDAFQADNTPKDMLVAIKNNQDFFFAEDKIFHFCAPTLTGLSPSGIGIPETIANFSTIYLLQIYKWIDQVVGRDYMLPFRVFTPEAGNNIGTGIDQMTASSWGPQLKKMVSEHRKDPFAMHSMPFPINMQEFGASGKMLVPKDLIEYQTNLMMDSAGFPAELFKGTLGIQETPTALRILEQSFNFMATGFSNFVRWYTSSVADYLAIDDPQIELKTPSLADTVELRQLNMQLASAGEISREEAYAPFIKDPVRKAIDRVKEDMEIQKGQAMVQEQAEREATMGSMNSVVGAMEEQEAAAQQAPPMAGGGGAGPSGGMTPNGVEEKAAQLTQEFLNIQDNGQRSKALQNLKATDALTYSRVKQLMEEARSAGASAGRQQAAQMVAPPQ